MQLFIQNIFLCIPQNRPVISFLLLSLAKKVDGMQPSTQNPMIWQVYLQKKLLENKTVLEKQGLLYIAHYYQSISLQTKLITQKPVHKASMPQLFP